MTMKTKLITIVAAYFVLGFIASCECPDYAPYFDYSSVNFNESIVNNEFHFNLNPEGKTFLAAKPNFDFFNSAYAMQGCPKDGDEGEKYKITKIEFYSDSSYNDTLSSGTYLNSVIKFYSPGKDTSLVLSATGSEVEHIQFASFIMNKPENPVKNFRLKVKITKENGSIVYGTSEIIKVFEE